MFWSSRLVKMLQKIIYFILLISARTCGSDGAAYDQQASSILPNFSDLSSFNTMDNFAQPTISHKSFVEHLSPGNGGSSRTTGTRSSTLLNKAIAQQGAYPYPAINPSSYTNFQMASPNFLNGLLGVPSINYANSGIFSEGLPGASINKAISSFPGTISLNIDHTTPGSHSVTTPNGISSLNNNMDGTQPSRFINYPFDKINIPAPEIVSVSVSSSSDDDAHIKVPSSPVKVPFVNYGNDEFLSIGHLGTSLSNDVISIPNAVSINSVNEHGPASSISTTNPVADVPVKVSSSVGPAESSFYSSLGATAGNPSPARQFENSLDKNIISIPNTMSTNSFPGLEAPISISAATHVAAVPVKVSSSLGPAESSFYSSLGVTAENPSPAKQHGNSLDKDLISIPNTVSTNSFSGLEAPASISTATRVDAVPIQVSSSIGPAESSFYSSVGNIVEKPSPVYAPTSITLQNTAASSNQSPSVHYVPENSFPIPAISQASSSHPTTSTSQTSVNNYPSPPASDLLSLLGNGYNNNNPGGILSSGFLGAPISSILGLNGKELSSNGLFSVSNTGNNENLGVRISNAPVFGNTDGPLKNFETVIQHTTPTSSAAPIPFSEINNNNLFNGLSSNGIFSDPIGFPNGIFGNTYNGMNGFGGGNFAPDNILSKYLWR